ncbi:MAG: glucose-6-phosphate 1-epimerase [Candidatus Endobugula sp.]|jgi:glucose-6-phosphate 1-epimerase
MNIIDTIQSLYKDYGQLKGVTIECQKELVAIGIKNQAATAEVFIQGAQITRYQGIDESPTLFLSKACDYKKGSALRGGIPICWPWFGDLAKNPEAVKQQLINDDQAATTTVFPAHGFVRQRDWAVESIRTPADDLTIVELSYHVKDEPLWPFETLLTYRIAIGETLSTSLHITNKSPQAFVFSGALHSYFAVSHIDNVSISGLDQCEYYDALDADDKGEWRVKRQQGDITFTEEVDRVYQSSDTPVVIIDNSRGSINKKRTLRLQSSGSKSAVVWNPWIEKSQALSQCKEDDYQRMVCIETANAVDDVVRLEPNSVHELQITLSSTNNN